MRSASCLLFILFCTPICSVLIWHGRPARSHNDLFAPGPAALMPGNGSTGVDEAGRRRLPSRLMLPPVFEVNRGQVDAQTRFISRVSGAELSLDTHGVKWSWAKTVASGYAGANWIRMNFAASNPNMLIEGVEEQPGHINYLAGVDRRRWRTNIPTYGGVRYREVYPGIDVLFHRNRQQHELDFVLAPGAQVASIQLTFERAEHLEIGRNGDLCVQTGGHRLIQQKPAAYQYINGNRHSVAGRLVRLSGNKISIAVEAYDRSTELIVDPILTYSTYFPADFYGGAALDAEGNLYFSGGVAGVSGGNTLPITPGAFRNTCGAQYCNGVFVAKLSTAGSLVYATYIFSTESTNGFDVPQIAVDDNGNAYVAGTTTARDFPTTPGAFRTSGGGSYILKLNSAGSGLEFATFLGGSTVAALTVDRRGSAYIVGGTGPNLLTTSGAPIPAHDGGSCINEFVVPVLFYPCSRAFLTKLNPSGTALQFSTYLGRGGDGAGSSATAIAVDIDGRSYVGGYTFGGSVAPTFGAFQTSCPSPGVPVEIYTPSAFVTSIDPSGSRISPSAVFGCYASVQSLALDTAGNVYLGGNPASVNTPEAYISVPITPGAYQTDAHTGICGLTTCSSGFVAKLSEDLTQLIYATYLGGGGETFTGITVSATGSVFTTGYTRSPSFPVTSDALQPIKGSSDDAFFAELSATGTTLQYSTFLGDGGRGSVDQARSILRGPDGVWIVGTTRSSDFPTLNSLYSNPPYPASLFVAKFGEGTKTPKPLFSALQVVNGASLLPGPITSNELVTIFGMNLASPAGVGPRIISGRVSDALSNSRVFIDGHPVPLLYTSSTQINAVIPSNVFEYSPDFTTQLQIEYLGQKSDIVKIPLTPMTSVGSGATPGLFTVSASGKGQGAIVNQDGTINSASSPAKRGSVVSIYGTGYGPTYPGLAPGIIIVAPLPSLVLPVTATIGGQPARVSYSGAAPNLVAGVLQVNAEVSPLAIAGDAVPVVVTVGGVNSQPGVTMVVR